MAPMNWKLPYNHMKKKRLTEAERLKREANRCFGDIAKLAPEDRARRKAPDPTPAYLFEHAEKLLNRTARRRNDSNDFEVQEIVDEDFCSGNLCNEPHARRREFKVRFVGYGPEGDEWLPRSKIDADDLISAFRALHPPPVSPAESTDDESDNDEQPAEQMPLIAPSPHPARVREAQRNTERTDVSMSPSSSPRPPSRRRSPSPPPRAARSRTPVPQQSHRAARGAEHGRHQNYCCEDCARQGHLIALPEKSSLPTDHFDRRLRLLTDLERRWARYHRTRGADRARYRNLGSAVVKENFEGVFQVFDVSRRSFTYEQQRSIKNAIFRGLYPVEI